MPHNPHFLLAGNKPEYSAKPHYENDEAKTKAAKSQTIEGTDESPASFGLGIGATLPVSKAVDIFANADAKMNADYFGYQANAGISFKFGNNGAAKGKTAARRKVRRVRR